MRDRDQVSGVRCSERMGKWRVAGGKWATRHSARATCHSAPAFTLVELLAVVFIIAIITAVALPGLKAIQATATQSATRHVASTLSLARQHAITKRTRTRVVFPYSATLSTATSSITRYLTFSVMASNRTTAAWEYIHKWEFLPSGVVFLNTGTGALNTGLTNAPVPFPTNGAANATLAWVEFRPTGAATAAATLRLAEGALTNSLPFVTSSNRADIAVDQLVGRIKVTRP